MAIKGLTDRIAGFPVIGTIRKGEKKVVNKSGKTIKPGKDLDYFRVEFDPEEKKSEEIFRSVYHEKPKFIRVAFPFDEIPKVFDTALETYTANNVMIARSDGEYFQYLINKDGEVVVHDENSKEFPFTPTVPYIKEDGTEIQLTLKPVGRLMVVLPIFRRACYMKVITHSKNDIANITSNLKAFKHINNDKLVRVPFYVRRRKTMVTVPLKGKRIRKLMSLISVEAESNWYVDKFRVLPNNEPSVQLEPSLIIEEPPSEDANYFFDEFDDEDESIIE